jgi:hypothetical protein
MQRSKATFNGLRLNEYVAETGITWESLAKRSGESYSTVSRYLQKSEKVGCRPEKLANVLAALNEERDRKGLRQVSVESLQGERRRSLSECLQHFLGWAPLRDAKQLAVDALALDMTAGFENLQQFCRHVQIPTAIRLLMLDSFIGDDIPCDVAAWCHAADAQYNLIQNKIREASGAYTVELQLRRYRKCPTYHGVRAQADSHTIYYVTKCGERDWRLSDYHWGEFEYLIVDQNMHGENAEECRHQFDDIFSKLWVSSKGFVRRF